MAIDISFYKGTGTGDPYHTIGELTGSEYVGLKTNINTAVRGIEEIIAWIDKTKIDAYLDFHKTSDSDKSGFKAAYTVESISTLKTFLQDRMSIVIFEGDAKVAAYYLKLGHRDHLAGSTSRPNLDRTIFINAAYSSISDARTLKKSILHEISHLAIRTTDSYDVPKPTNSYFDAELLAINFIDAYDKKDSTSGSGRRRRT